MSSWFIRRANITAGAVGGSRLPAEFDELAFIQSSGTQWIDTGIVPDFDTEVHLVASVIDWGSNGMLACTRTGTSDSCRFFVYARSGNNDRIVMGSTTFTFTRPAAGTILDIVFNEHSTHNVSVNGNHIGSFTTGNVVNQQNTLYLCATSGYSTNHYPSSSKIYSLDIKNNGVLVMSLVPAKRKADNEVGMYDLVSNTFLTNAGSGSFSYGEL